MLFTIIGGILVFAGAALIIKDTRSEPAVIEAALEEAIDQIIDLEDPKHEA